MQYHHDPYPEAWTVYVHWYLELASPPPCDQVKDGLLEDETPMAQVPCNPSGNQVTI
jgi:hypothetical protein